MFLTVSPKNEKENEIFDTGKEIASIRKKKGYTQKQLAEKLCVTDKAVSRWENGYNLPDITLLPKIADILGISVDRLLRGSAEKKNDEQIPAPVESNKDDKIENRKEEISAMGHVIEERLKDKEAGIFRLHLRQITANQFTLPAALCYILSAILFLLFSPIRVHWHGETFYLSIFDHLRGLFEKSFSDNYFSLHESNVLETFMTLLCFMQVPLLIFALCLSAEAINGNFANKPRRQWIFAGLTVGIFFIQSICVPCANKIYGLKKYSVSPLQYPIIVLSLLQLLFAYAVNSHRKPKKRIRKFSILSVGLIILLFFSSAMGEYSALPHILTAKSKTETSGELLYNISMVNGQYVTFLPPFCVETNKTYRNIYVTEIHAVFQSTQNDDEIMRYDEQNRIPCSYLTHYKMKNGFAVIVHLTSTLGRSLYYPQYNLLSLNFTLSFEGTDIRYDYSSTKFIDNQEWFDLLTIAEENLSYIRKFTSDDF